MIKDHKLIGNRVLKKIQIKHLKIFLFIYLTIDKLLRGKFIVYLLEKVVKINIINLEIQ